MRQSVRIILVLLWLGGVFGLMSSPVAAGTTVGFVPGQGPVRTIADAEVLANLLSARLNTQVDVRLFSSEENLHQWLNRYREVDFGWFGEAFLRKRPAGDLLPLAVAERPGGEAFPGKLVARQGVDAVLLQQMRDALLMLGQRSEEIPPLAAMEVVRFSGMAAADDGLLILPPVEMMADQRPPQLSSPATVQTAPTTMASEPPVLLSADQLDYDNENRLVQARGAVTLQQGDTLLTADELLWQESTRDVAALGNFRLAEPDAEMHGSSLHANLATRMGFARKGRVTLRERNFHLTGEEMERLGEASYRIKEGSFTTCDGEIPDWQFTAEQVDVTLGRYATARNVWFEIRDTPILYLPYLIFPAKAERESGFLLPRAGYSSRKGAMLSLAWYEVIDRNLDATLYLDYLSRIGVGTGAELRYVLAGDNAGEALLYRVTGVNGNDDTFAFKWRHGGDLPGGFRLTADVDYVEDIEYFEDFGDIAEEYTRDQAVSTLMLQRNWEHLNLTVLAQYIRDLDDDRIDNDTIPQRLPEIDLSVPLRRLGHSPFYVRADSVLTNFVREEGVDGQRVYVNPELKAVFRPGSWLELTPKVAAHGRYYRIDSTDGTLGRDDYDDESLVGEYALTASTRLARVFPFGRWGIEKLRHSIEPEVTYVYIPETSQERLPSYDVYDRIGPSNRIEYALINRLTGRAVDADGRPSYRELLNLRLSQAYDLAIARDDDVHNREPFSPLRVEVRANPTAESSLSLDTLLPVHGDRRFSRITASAGYSGARGNTAALNYTYLGSDYSDEPSDYLELRLATALLAPVYADFRERYDFREGRSLESLLNLEYRSKCWSLFLSLRNRSSGDGGSNENEIMVGFSLAGIGRVGGFGSKLTAPETALETSTETMP